MPQKCFAATLLAGCLTSTALAGELVLAGIHPTSLLTPFPAIHVLKAFEGRIYMGYGDWSFSPAVALVSYEPETGTFRPEHAVGSDSIGTFRVLGGELFVPSTDPVHFEDFTDFSVRSSGVWRRSALAGFLHGFDIATLTGSDRWFVGAKTVNETPNTNAAVWRSTDGGESWTDVTLQSEQLRYRYCFTLRGNLYVRDTVYDGTGATRIPAFPYDLLYKPINLVSGSNEMVFGLAQQTPGIGSFVRATLGLILRNTWDRYRAAATRGCGRLCADCVSASRHRCFGSPGIYLRSCSNSITWRERYAFRGCRWRSSVGL